MYKPPHGDCIECMTFFENFYESNPHAELWVLGDFNIDFLKCNVNSTKKVTEYIRKMGLDQLIKHVTRPSGRKGTCIDWILTNSEYVSMSFVSNNLISDHYPVIVVRKKSREMKQKEPKLRIDYCGLRPI